FRISSNDRTSLVCPDGKTIEAEAAHGNLTRHYRTWRLDYVREYMEASETYFSVREYWDSLGYIYGGMDHNQDAHRQRIIHWIKDTNGTTGGLDSPQKEFFILQLKYVNAGWWPSRAVYFIENHDTGST
ncbi:alpha-amylase, partial [Tanacetum coccineum]